MQEHSMPHPNSKLRDERLRRQWTQQDLADHLQTTKLTIGRWERGISTPGPHFRLKLCVLFGKSAEELGLIPESPQPAAPTETSTSVKIVPLSHSLDAPGVWGVPYPRNPFFTGRKELLHSLREQLKREHTMALTQAWAISGLGGIGKTQIALEYACRYRYDYAAVFWISAATRETLSSGFVMIADLLQLPEKGERDQNKVIQAVRKWLVTHQRWLLILDNADDIAIMQDIVLSEHSGHLLLTTRLQALGPVAQRIEVETMGMAEATLFLLRRTRSLTPDAPMDAPSEETLAAVESIIIEMDFLPLALDQAGAYIDEVGCSPVTYLERYRTYRKELLRRRGHVPTDHPESVATTWSLSFEKIEQANPAAAELLRICAFLEPDAIPEELISQGSAHLGPILGPAAMNMLLLDGAIEQLRKFSLVQRNPETRVLRIHRLVQAVLKDVMEMGERHQWSERAVRATNGAFPEIVEMATWPHCRRYLPQAQACTVLIQDSEFAFVEATSLLFRTASYLRDVALYEQAEPLFQQALQIREQVLGLKHPEVATLLNGLAVLYRLQGKYEQAEPLLQRAMRIWKQALEPNHPEVATSLNGLAVLYWLQGKYEQAEPLFQQAVRIREQALRPNHPEVAASLNGLALLYWKQGKYGQAEPLLQRAVHIWEQTLGLDHLHVAGGLQNLALLYCEQEKYEQAESLYQRAWRIWEQALGPDHPDLARVLNNLGELYYKQGRHEQAEPLFQQSWRIWEQALGPDHPEVAYPLNGLANLYHVQGRHEQAELLFQRVLSIRECHLEPQHPDIAETLYDFAVFQEAHGKLQEAVSFYQRALVIREQILGAHHPTTTDTRKRLRATLQAMDKTTKFEKA